MKTPDKYKSGEKATEKKIINPSSIVQLQK